MAADEEKRAAIRELSTKFDQNSFQLKALESQRRQNEMALRRAAFTAAHLDELPENVPTYSAVGKAYFLEPKLAVMSRLQEVVEKTGKELKTAGSAREGLLSAQEGLKNELNELIGIQKR